MSQCFISPHWTLKTLPGLIEVSAELLEADLRLLTEVQETATTPPHVRLHWMKNRSQWSKQWVLKLMAQPHCPLGVGVDLSSLRRPEILDSLKQTPHLGQRCLTRRKNLKSPPQKKGFNHFQIVLYLAKSQTPEQQWEFAQRLKKMRLV